MERVAEWPEQAQENPFTLADDGIIIRNVRHASLMNSGKSIAAWSVAWTTDRRGPACDDSPPPRRCTVSDSNYEQKRALECLRLASDLTQLSSETLNPDLKAHCVRMADVWTDRAALWPTDDPAPSGLSVH